MNWLSPSTPVLNGHAGEGTRCPEKRYDLSDLETPQISGVQARVGLPLPDEQSLHQQWVSPLDLLPTLSRGRW